MRKLQHFRRRPEHVTAEQFDGTAECAERLGLKDFDPVFGCAVLGFYKLDENDWVVTSSNGERYKLKNAEFVSLYEPLSNPPEDYSE